MASPTPDLGAFSTAEKNALLTAIKSEILLRATPGSVRSGSSAGQNFNVDKWSETNLILWLNALTIDLGYQQPELRVSPNFRGTPPAYYQSTATP